MKVITLVIVLAATALLPAAQKPIKEEVRIVDTMPPPPTAEAMTAAATAVILATYTGKARLKEVTSADGSPLSRWTTHTFQIQDILKLHQYLPFVGNNLELDFLGGDKEFPDYISRETDREVAPLIKGHTYLIFLGWNRYTEKLVVNYGAGGLFDVTDGQLIAVHKHGRKFDHTPTAAFVGAVRAAGN